MPPGHSAFRVAVTAVATYQGRQNVIMKLPDIDALIAGRIDPKGPGVAVAVVHDGSVVYQQGHGLANLEWNEPLAPDSVLALGSLTKPFTAQAVLLLELAGKLRVEDSVAIYLPELAWLDPSITILHLLTHTSGIANYVSQPEFWKRVAQRDHTPVELASYIGDLKPDFPPGTAYSYSNSGYHLLGMLIAAVSGQPYDQYLRTAIFEPLRMSATRYLWHDGVVPRRADGYELPEKEHSQQAYRHAPYLSPTLTGPGGGLGSTLQDLLIWDAALREHRLLPPEVEARRRLPVALRDGRRMGYGLGWGLSEYRGRAVVHHAGGVPGFSSFYGHFEDDALTIIALANLGGFDAAGLAADIANQALDLPLPERTPVAVPTTELVDAEGVYANLVGERLRITRSGERLVMDGNLRGEFMPLGDATFASVATPDVTIHFETRDGAGYTNARVVVPFYWYVVGRLAKGDEKAPAGSSPSDSAPVS
jgi:CubicO group peptidase (beta-lactamase class C family)